MLLLLFIFKYHWVNSSIYDWPRKRAKLSLIFNLQTYGTKTKQAQFLLFPKLSYYCPLFTYNFNIPQLGLCHIFVIKRNWGHFPRSTLRFWSGIISSFLKSLISTELLTKWQLIHFFMWMFWRCFSLSGPVLKVRRFSLSASVYIGFQDLI